MDAVGEAAAAAAAPSALTARERRAWRAYQLVAAQLGAALAHAMQSDGGVSEAEFEVLTALAVADRGALRARDLRCELRWEKSRLAHLVRRMEERGLVRRAVCDEDSRAPIVLITDAGLAAVRRATPPHEARVRHLFADPLTAAQLDAVADAMETIAARLATCPRPPDADTD